MTMVDIDGWYARDLIVPLFFNDNVEQYNLIRKCLILPYLTVSFHPSFIDEYEVRLVMSQKQDGGIFVPSYVERSGALFRQSRSSLYPCPT